jgi:hypothetical protein
VNLVIVAYHFPPDTAVGAMRASGLAKYLSARGHRVTVLTAQETPAAGQYTVETLPGLMPSVRLKRRLGIGQHESLASLAGGGSSSGSLYGALRWLIGICRQVLFWPDEARGWGRRVSRALSRQLASSAVDAVISTGPPYSAHLAVMRATDVSDVVWVADFRDLWTQSPHYAFGGVRRLMDARAEASVVNGADCVTVATTSFERALRCRHPAARIEAVYNGFDPELFCSMPPPVSAGCLRVVYAGNLYGGKRDPSLVFEAASALFEAGVIPRERFRLDFYSPAEPTLLAAIERYGLNGTVVVHGTRPRSEVLDRLCESDVLLLLQWSDPAESEALPAKIFEYLGARRFILSCGAAEDSEVTRILASTRAGVNVTTAAGAVALLQELWEQFLALGQVPWPGREADRATFTQDAMAARMEEILMGRRAKCVRVADSGLAER